MHRRPWRHVAAQLESQSSLRIALVLYLVALVAVLGTGLLHHFRPIPGLLEADELEYYSMSSKIISGDFAISPRRTIGFPLLLAGIRLVHDNFLFLQIVLSSIFATSAPLIFRLMRTIGADRIVAVASSLIFIFWPPDLYYGTSIYSETAALPAFLLALSTLPSPWRERNSLRGTVMLALLSGLLLGVAAHIRPMYLLFLPVAALIILTEGKLRRIAWIKLGSVLAGFAILVLPWSMLMEHRFHQMIVLSANGGETLAGGLNPRLLDPAMQSTVDVSGRMVWNGPGKWLPIGDTGYLTKADKHLPYLAQDRVLKERAVKWAVSHPVQAAKLEFYKAAYMWGIYPIQRNSTVQILFGNVPLLLLLGLSCYFMAAQPLSRRRYVRLWTLALYVTGIGLISWGSWRFRQVGDVGLICYCVACGWSRYGSVLMGKDQGEATAEREDAHAALAEAPV